MKVEGNELSVFSFMFTAGTATGLFLQESKLFGNHLYELAVLFFYIAILSASAAATIPFLLKKHEKVYWKKFSAIMLAAAFMHSGIFGSTAHYIADIHYRSLEVSISAQALKSQIDSIPYKDSSSNALVKALLTGDKSDLSIDLKNCFRKSGASHLLALSGMHLGIVYIIISRILSLCGNSPTVKKLRSLISVSAAGFYTLMTGAGPSIVRAFLFISINESAICLNRRSSPQNTFCTALLIQLTFSPESIISAGFQLSYLAMAGIYFLYPSIKKWYGTLASLAGKQNNIRHGSRFDPVHRLWNAAALTISCQIFTAPAAWVHFRSFPVYFLITNIIAMPLTTVVIQLAIIVTALHTAGTCPDFITEISEQAIRLLIFCIKATGE